MIRVVKEPEGAGPPYERCCFCWRQTMWWHAKKDVAVCPECAITHKTDQIPKKADWCKQTAGLDKGAPPTTNDAPVPSGSGVREAFDIASGLLRDGCTYADRKAAADYIRALASDASPRGEAVAWMVQYENGCRNFYLCEQWALPAGWTQTPLYAHPAAATVESVETLKARLGSYAITEEYDFPGDAEEFCGYWCHECREHVEADGTGHGKDCPCYGVAPNTPRAVKERAALAPGSFVASASCPQEPAKAWNAEPSHDWPDGQYIGATCSVCGVSGFMHPKRAPRYCWPHYQQAMKDAEWHRAEWEAGMTAEYGPYTPKPSPFWHPNHADAHSKEPSRAAMPKEAGK